MFDIPTIYQETHYPVPENIVTEWSKGIGFGRTEEYTAEEKANLEKDMEAIRDHFLSQNSNIFTRAVDKIVPQKVKTFLSPSVSYVSNSIVSLIQRLGFFEKQILLTAGAPGAGKTTLLESIIAKDNNTSPYVDPDAVFLKRLMKNSYQAELDKLLAEPGADEKQIRQDMYNKWRPASNYLTHIWQAYLISQKSNFVFGTTSSSPQMGSTFKYYKDQGYKINVIHISAPDQVRWDSIKLRDKTFVQTTEEDIREKGKLVPQRINDTYLASADNIEFYYREKADGDAVHTASWFRDKKIVVHNPEKYNAMVALHNQLETNIPWPL